MLCEERMTIAVSSSSQCDEEPQFPAKLLLYQQANLAKQEAKQLISMSLKLLDKLPTSYCRATVLWELNRVGGGNLALKHGCDGCLLWSTVCRRRYAIQSLGSDGLLCTVSREFFKSQLQWQLCSPRRSLGSEGRPRACGGAVAWPSVGASCRLVAGGGARNLIDKQRVVEAAARRGGNGRGRRVAEDDGALSAISSNKPQ